MIHIMRAIVSCLLVFPLMLSAFSEEQTSDDMAAFGYLFDRYPPIHFSTSTHRLHSSTGDSIELEDGSIWKISRYDSHKALSWRLSDPVVITQNHRWFSNYTYRIVNQATGSIIEANLFLGPLVYGEHSLYICALNSFHGDLLLVNAHGETTRWIVAPNDCTSLQYWTLNDVVIVGQNSGWDANYEGILINVNANGFVRASQIP